MKKPSLVSIKNWLLDLFFPKFCVGCKKEGNWLCKSCQKNIVAVVSQVCPQCGRLSPQGLYCRLCRFEVILQKVKGQRKPKKLKRRKPLKGIISSLYYEEGPTKEIIHNIKYNSVIELVPVLGKAMAIALKNNLPDKNILITFAPLHRRRLVQRGFNQAELLAKNIAESIKVPAKGILIKKRNTKRQVELKGSLRRKNLAGVFAVRGSGDLQVAGRPFAISHPSQPIRSFQFASRLAVRIEALLNRHSAQRHPRAPDLHDKTIVIVDDVTTTGATLNECAKVLKAAGAKEVWGLVAARG